MAIQSISVKKITPEFMAVMNLDPKEHKGVAEVLNILLPISYADHAKKFKTAEKAHIIKSMRNMAEYRFGELIHHHADFYDDEESIPESVYCALIGGTALQFRTWAHPAARDGKRIVDCAAQITVNDSETLEAADNDTRFYYMMDLLLDLQNAHISMEQTPHVLKEATVTEFARVATIAQNSKFESSTLTKAIGEKLDDVELCLHQMQQRFTALKARP